MEYGFRQVKKVSHPNEEGQTWYEYKNLDTLVLAIKSESAIRDLNDVEVLNNDFKEPAQVYGFTLMQNNDYLEALVNYDWNGLADKLNKANIKVDYRRTLLKGYDEEDILFKEGSPEYLMLIATASMYEAVKLGNGLHSLDAYFRIYKDDEEVTLMFVL